MNFPKEHNLQLNGFQCPTMKGIETDWAVTVAIPAFKKLTVLGRYAPYSKFSGEEQKRFLEDSIKASLYNVLLYDIFIMPELFFEAHQDGRIHAHFAFKCDYDTIYLWQKHFCTDFIHIRPKQFQQVFNFFQPDSFHYWNTYIRKCQEADEELKEINNLLNNI